mgnify:FL=1
MKKSAQLPIFSDAWYDALCTEGLCEGAHKQQHFKCQRMSCFAGRYNVLNSELAIHAERPAQPGVAR